MQYLVEVYIVDYICLAIPTSHAQLDITNSIMSASHDIFPLDGKADQNPISPKRLLQQEGLWDVIKEILGIVVNGDDKMVWLAERNQDALICMLKG